MSPSDSIKPYIAVSGAALAELSLGLPLDRIKISQQSGIPVKWVGHGSRMQMARYWYAGNVPSIIQRCGIYLPAIQASNSLYNRLVYPRINPSDRAKSELLIKPMFLSALVTPYVSLFEGLKTAQQHGAYRVYPEYVTRYLAKLGTHPGSGTESMREILRAVNAAKARRLLFASVVPTWGRECFFIGGMCVVQPIITSTVYQFMPHIALAYSTVPVTIAGSLVASLVCQTASQPLDVLKTRCEIRPSIPLSGQVSELWYTCKTYGFRKTLYSGWLPRVTRGAWTFTCMRLVTDYLHRTL
jgi:hypothetical protein